MYYKVVFIFLNIVPYISSFFNNITPKLANRFLKMNKDNRDEYKYTKIYYEFYKKYKKPSALQSNIFVNYKEFSEKYKNNFEIFKKNYKLIEITRAQLENSNSTFTIDINEYADTVDFESEYNLDLNLNLQQCSKPFSKYSIAPLSKIIKRPFNNLKYFMQNKRFNWNDTEHLSPVKNQGQCGSCWAFSTTTVVETFMRNNNFTVERLSEQQLVDCSKEDYGCNGGLMHTALEYIINNKGLLENKNYPYKATTQNCSSNTNNTPNAIGSNITDYEYIIPKSIVDMKKSVLQSPVAIAIDANNLYFRFYKEGVIDVPNNVSHNLNHAVTLVGFDYDEKGMYWIIQNSWGKEWGDNGFCKVRAKPGDGTLMCQLYGVYPID